MIALVLTRRLLTLATIVAILLQPMQGAFSQSGCGLVATVGEETSSRHVCSGCQQCRVDGAEARCSCCAGKSAKVDQPSQQPAEAELSKGSGRKSCCGASLVVAKAELPKNTSVAESRVETDQLMAQPDTSVGQSTSLDCGCRAPAQSSLPTSPRSSDLRQLGQDHSLSAHPAPFGLRFQKATRRPLASSIEANRLGLPLHFAQQRFSVWQI